MKYRNLIIVSVAITSIVSCNTSIEKSKEIAINSDTLEKKAVLPSKPTSEAFKKYWYAGEAEITSYKLEQARYGEVR